MALLLRVLRAALGSVARALGLFVALFFGYLLWSRAWPAYRVATHLAAQRPQLQQLVDQLQRDFGKRQTTIEQLHVRLSQLAREQHQLLAEQVSTLESVLEDETERFQRLRDELATAVSEQEKYCQTWNPLKRWMCSEVEARTKRTREVIEPLIARATESKTQVENQLSQAKSALANFSPEDLLQTAHGSEALLLRAAVAEQASALREIQTALADGQVQLARAIEADLSPWGWLQRELRSVGPHLFAIVVVVLVTPWLQRVVAYFILMPLVERAKLLQLVDDNRGHIKVETAKRSLLLSLRPGEKCWARADYVRPVEGHTRSQWLLDWRAPFVSYAAGLTILTRIEVPSDAESTVATTLASPQHSDSYLIELTLERAEGLVFHPRHLVAVTGDIELWTVWRLSSWHAWATGQLRYIGVEGLAGVCSRGSGIS